MKAAVHFEYGEPDLLRIVDLPKPACPVAGCVVKVKACSINPADWKYIHGNWRLFTGNRFPRRTGTDFAGVVESVGPKVAAFKPGDSVMGSINPFRTGAAAEYVAAKEAHLCALPSGLDYYEAAGIPIAGGTAYIGLARSSVGLKARKVLITGAGGGVGHLAVQLAKNLGARVTAVCSAAKHDFVRSLGADEVVDYHDVDVNDLGGPYAVILDCAASLGYRSAKPLLEKRGEFLLIEQKGKVWLFGVSVLSGMLGGRRMRTFVAAPSGDRCRELKSLFEAGHLRMTVSRRFPLDRIGEALCILKEGHATGKMVIDIK